MSENDIKQMQEKIDEGIRKAQEKLVEKVKKEDGKLVVTRDGKVVTLNANEV
jgi:low affinity Fe/Cu permease